MIAWLSASSVCGPKFIVPIAKGGGRREKVVIATKVYSSMAADGRTAWPNHDKLSALSIRRRQMPGKQPRARDGCARARVPFPGSAPFPSPGSAPAGGVRLSDAPRLPHRPRERLRDPVLAVRVGVGAVVGVGVDVVRLGGRGQQER